MGNNDMGAFLALCLGMAVVIAVFTGNFRDYEAEARAIAKRHAIQEVDSWWTQARGSYLEVIGKIGDAEETEEKVWTVTGVVCPRTIVGLRKYVAYICVVDFNEDPARVVEFQPFETGTVKDEEDLGEVLRKIVEGYKSDE